MECIFQDERASKGECDPIRNCQKSDLVDPHCGVDGKTYKNKDELLCNRMSLLHLG